MSGLKAHCKGTITREIELQYTNNSGMAFCRIPLACNWVEQGEKKTQYVDGTAWGKTAEFAASWVRQGARVVVDMDRVHIREFQRQDGSSGTSLSGTINELDLIDWPSDQDQEGGGTTPNAADTGGFNDVNFDSGAGNAETPAPAEAPVAAAGYAGGDVQFDDPFNDEPPF